MAIAWKAPPSTRSVIGSTSTRFRVGRARLAADLVLESTLTSVGTPWTRQRRLADACDRLGRGDAPEPITMFPKRSIWAVRPGGITVVESYWLTIAGPSSRFPAFSAARS